MPGICAVVLAAGGARRFGADKLLAPLGDRPVLAHTLASLDGLALSARIGVVGPGDAGREDLLRAHGCRVVRNPNPARGQASSLRRGLAAVPQGSAALVLLGDMPGVDAALLRAVVGSGRTPALCARGETLLPPALIPAARVGAARASGDRGASAWLRSLPGLRRVQLTAGQARDVDTPADLRALGRGMKSTVTSAITEALA